MVSIARKNLFAEKTRLLISVGGVAFSVLLIITILSLFQGWHIKSIAYIKNIDTDIWVTQAGASDITHSISLIPTLLEPELNKIVGVETTSFFIGSQIGFDLNGEDINMYLVGVGEKNALTIPKKIINGKRLPGAREIIIDKVFARKKNLKLGEFLNIHGRSFKIVGIADETNMFVFQFGFISEEEARNMFAQSVTNNFYFVKATKGSLEKVKVEINRLPDVKAFASTEFIDINKKPINEIFLPIITVLVFISVLVGTTIIGLTIYTATIEKTREYGVLKALGASNLQIYRIIFEQSIISGVLGFFVGLILSFGLLAIIPYFAPTFVTVVRPVDLVWIFILAISMSLLASYIPVRIILRIDPALVFKS